MNEEQIKDFWGQNPCGEILVDGLDRHQSYENFFTAYDDYRYRTESHIPACLDNIDFAGKRCLEIGLG